MSAGTSFYTSTSVAGYMPMPSAEPQQGKADMAIPAKPIIPHSRFWSVGFTNQMIQEQTLEQLRVFELAKGILCSQCLESAKARQAALKQQFRLSGSLTDEERFTKFHPLTDEQITDLIRADFERLYQWMPTFAGHQWRLFTQADVQRIDFTKLMQTPEEQIKIMVGRIFDILESTLGKERLLGLKGDNLTVLFPFFKRAHFVALTPEQVNTVDFKKAVISQCIFRELFDGSIWGNKAWERLQGLSEDNLTVLLKRFPGYFDRTLTYCLTIKQISKIDFTKANIDQELFTQIFGPFPARLGLKHPEPEPEVYAERLKAVSPQNLLPLIQFLTPWHREHLSAEQSTFIQKITKDKSRESKNGEVMT